MIADGILHGLVNLIDQLRVVDGILRGSQHRIKVAGDRFAAVFPDHVVSGHQLKHTLEESFREDGVFEGEILLQSLEINLLLIERVFQYTLDLRCVDDVSVNFCIIKRFNAKHISGGEHFLLLSVPQNESKHASEAVEHRSAPLFIAVQENLCVGAAGKDVTARLQFLLQLLVIVDFAVKGTYEGAVFVVHRLGSGICQINDGETSVSHGDIRADILASAVRAPVYHPVHHICQNWFLLYISSGKSADSTHIFIPFFYLL